VRPRHDGVAAGAVLDHVPIDALPLNLPRRRNLDAQRRASDDNEAASPIAIIDLRMISSPTIATLSPIRGAGVNHAL
jgi:hypothetical protein